jgi:hypothetical protein
MPRRPLRAAAIVLGTLAAVAAPPRAGAQQPARDTTAATPIRGALPEAVQREATDIFNAPATLRVAGSLDVPQNRVVEGDVAVLNGPATVSGRITGRLVAINADVTLRPGARVDGDVLVVGGALDGRVRDAAGGSVRVYREALYYRQDGDVIIAERDPEAGARFWSPFRRTRQNGGATTLYLSSAHTYNRVEGLPVYVGPTYDRTLRQWRVQVDALGIVRTAGILADWQNRENLGHLVRAEARYGRGRGVRLGGQLYDEVAPVEDWQLGDAEVGLATFFLHRDYRDYYNRHGASASLALQASADASLTLSLADERWDSRRTRDPWTVFRDSQRWRANPLMDHGRVHRLNATLHIDTRNDESDPWAGWYLVADYERGSGTFDRLAPLSGDVSVGAPAAPTRDAAPGRRTYGRGFADLRRYSRLSPNGQLNLRLALGGYLHGDPLPLQRRLSVTGPGALPGFDFRRAITERDRGQCGASARLTPGDPAECERIALVQAEYRHDLHVNLLGWDAEQDAGSWRRYGWRTDAAWVAFVDAGRGWLVGRRDGDRVYGRGSLPGLSTFATDVGVGLDFGDAAASDLSGIGFYVAKSVSSPSQAANFFVRVRRRF